jgi:hypothetical protein
MSVDKRRLAAAQRTAVGRTNPSRARRLGAWIIIVPALALFSFSVVAGAAGTRTKPDLEAAAAKVVPGGNADAGDKSQSPDSTKQKPDAGTLVVVDTSHSSGITDLFGKAGKQVCWISASQLVRVSAVYKTTSSTLKVGGKTYTLITVYGANEKALQQLLGSQAVKCTIVQAEHLFFLPFDPNLS